ncbi:chloride intracellular channel exc-4 [Ditylenchus destructor]|nr:chloride intracellular channel exc-4 [Ditylenchus destructor]
MNSVFETPNGGAGGPVTNGSNGSATHHSTATGGVVTNHSHYQPNQKPLLELYVKASGIDSRRIGACLFCQEFWMELYALYEVGVVRVEVKTVNVNSEAFKKNFLGASPPIMTEEEKETTYSDNREIEGRIFHLAKEFNVPLFEKDLTVEKAIQNLYRNFKIFLRAKVDHDKGKRQPSDIEGLPTQIAAAHNKLVEQLANIDQLLSQRQTRYLLGDTMTEYDCELMPRLHHMRIVGLRLLGFEIPHNFTYLWSYILTAYRTAAFIESCPADQDIIHHYKEQLNLVTNQRETLQQPTKTHTIPEDVLEDIRRLGLGN